MTEQMEAPRIPMTELQQTEAMPDGPVKQGRLAIEESTEFHSMREVQKTLSAHIEPFAKKKGDVEADNDLSDEGRARRIAAVEKDREERISAVIAEYDAREKAILNRFDAVEPRPLPVQSSDAPRLQVALAKISHLSPKQVLGSFQQAIDRKDHVWLQEMLPVLENLSAKDEYKAHVRGIPLGQADPIKQTVSATRDLLTGPNQHAARYAREALPKMRAELDKVVQSIREEGAWKGSIAQRTESTVAGHAVPSLSWLEE